jgi:hypothetical protein
MNARMKGVGALSNTLQACFDTALTRLLSMKLLLFQRFKIPTSS